MLTCSSKGKMYLFNWGEFGYHSDEYCGLKNSINSMIAITENMVVAGYEDGNIRYIVTQIPVTFLILQFAIKANKISSAKMYNYSILKRLCPKKHHY